MFWSTRISYRRIIIILSDAFVAAFCLWAAFMLRFDGSLPPAAYIAFLQLLPVAVSIKIVFFYIFKLHQGLWRYASTHDLVRIIKANTLSAAMLALYAVLAFRFEGVPRSAIPLDLGLSILIFGGKCLAVRLIDERRARRRGQNENGTSGICTLIVGAGDAGVVALRETQNNRDLLHRVVGFLDDNPDKHGMTIQGITVLGPLSSAPKWITAKEVREIIIAMPTAPKRVVREIVEQCRGLPARFSILPAMADLITGRLEAQQIRKIELNDLLGREPVCFDRGRVLNELRDRCVLVTGAGGSIGAEICRQVAVCKPSRLILLDIAETPLFHIEQELLKTCPGLKIEAVLADIRRPEDLRRVFRAHTPNYVFHAAAYKHVPLMETHPAEAAANNIFGTRNVGAIAREFKVDKFVMISTDKAVRPTSVMGASKRCAEILIQALNGGHTQYMVVRFGNVLGSNGSVVPTFKKQIAEGGPVTVTDPDVTRFFMTIPEAVELVLQAGTIGAGGDSFLLEMGEPVKIVDLAVSLIELSGLVPGEDIEIVFTGLRPGEKLYEELVAYGEDVEATDVPKLHVHHRAMAEADSFSADFENLEQLLVAQDIPGVRVLVWDIVRRFDKDCVVETTVV